MHDYLTEHGINIISFSDINPSLKGRTKRNKPINILPEQLSIKDIKDQQRPLIITDSARGVRQKIGTQLKELKLKPMHDYISVAQDKISMPNFYSGQINELR